MRLPRFAPIAWCKGESTCRRTNTTPTPPSGAPTTPSARRTASGPAHPLPPRPDARPRIVQDPVIIGLTRVSRSRLGSRLFTWFFVFVYLVIIVQLVWSILQG